MALTFHHLAIQVRDLRACERFYRDVLGLDLLRRWPRGGGGDRSVWLRLGEEAFLALERAAEGPAAGAETASPTHPGPGAGAARLPFLDGRPGLHLVALRIEPGARAAWEERLARLGVPVVHRTAYTLYLRDPEGNRVGLSHHPEEAPS